MQDSYCSPTSLPRSRAKRISTAVLRDATHWDEVVTKLGYEHLRRHDLRHTGLTRFADAGVQIHVLRRIAGHGSLMTTQRYLHPDVHRITAADTALSAHLSVLRAPCRARPSRPADAGQGGWSPAGPQKRLRTGFGFLRNRPCPATVSSRDDRI
ncbi:tyrosine-type recombinase/integrase [Streptomyces sp. ME01-18a]|uniref:tyrosine-type recombinase/integrase n=1 Tax=Streptomyces sp. ME01-18a TaxID=3028669 RepID=UPI0029B77FAB|nr:tyrosine-type recombinase/integrase [Streptomyces sp. ME01-18a]MDX3427380.1 tyrosine-type recombinase/integrase [Streptomyces sp. ME01-18a]